MIKTIPIFFCLLVMICTVRASEPSLAMWAWEQAHFNTAQARSEMLDFCEQEGISHIDQHVVIHKNIITNSDALKCLIVEAAQRDITVNALRGDKAMFLADNHELTLNAIETLVAFNRTLPEEAKLLGIKFDVEPYLSAQWKAGGEQRDRVIMEYLNCLTRARAYLNTHSPKLELAVDVPFWWDKDEYMVNFDGSIKHFVHHIQDCVDWLGIMSYRREAGKIIRLVEDELKYALKHELACSIAPSMETSNIKGKDSHISFGDVPPEQFRVALASLRSTYADNSIIRCIMLHHYGSLRTYLNRDRAP